MGDQLTTSTLQVLAPPPSPHTHMYTHTQTPTHTCTHIHTLTEPGTAHLSGNGLAECGRAAGSGGRTGGTVGGGGGGTPLFHLSQRGGDLPSNHTGTHGKYIRTLIPQSIYPCSEAVENEATEHCVCFELIVNLTGL